MPDTPPVIHHALRGLRDEIDQASRESNVGADYALFGSSVMFLHGLREHVSDIDVFVGWRLWVALQRKLIWILELPDPNDPPFISRLHYGMTVHAFYAWTPRDPEIRPWYYVESGYETIDGFHCIKLDEVLAHKLYSTRKHPDDPRQVKHHADIAAIKAHMAVLPSQATASLQ